MGNITDTVGLPGPLPWTLALSTSTPSIKDASGEGHLVPVSDLLYFLNSYAKREAQARAEARAAALEEAAKVAKDRADICLDAVRKIEAGELYQNIPDARATEHCAYMEALHIERSIRALIEESP